ncbi:class II aldolase/adducin family protein [bacterium]|nr:class II aldolase/adducin family protein [bacterium]
MRKVITGQEMDDLIKAGKSWKDLPEDAILAPAAEDLAAELPGYPGRERQVPAEAQPTHSWTPTPPPARNPAPAAGPPWEAVTGQYDAFYRSDLNFRRSEEICDIGRRMWAREYVDGNGGNISIRVGKNLALCTPTLVSKGFMKPEHICLVDLDGEQKAGTLRRTSEILMHLEIMKAQENAVACVHCHPPYATAFAAAGVQPPNNILPEYEIFIGQAPIADYVTPGTLDMAKKVAALSGDHNTILMANHGVVAWSHISVEDAYFKMEILEAYCRTIMVTTQLGRMPNRFTPEQMKALLDIKQTLGVPDPRFGLQVDRLKADDEQWRPGVTCIPNPPADCNCPPSDELDPEAAELVRAVTAKIMERLQS